MSDWFIHRSNGPVEELSQEQFDAKYYISYGKIYKRSKPDENVVAVPYNVSRPIGVPVHATGSRADFQTTRQGETICPECSTPHELGISGRTVCTCGTSLVRVGDFLWNWNAFQRGE